MPDEPKKLTCCEAMVEAQTDGTDGDGGKLLWWYTGDVEAMCDAEMPGWRMGLGLPAPSLCPWCGAKIGADHA